MTLETANRLYELRKKHSLSQEELAEKLGVSRQAVSKWERSEASPDTDNLIALAKIYGLSLDELIYGQKEESNEETRGESEEETCDDEEKKTSENEGNNADDTLYLDIEDGSNRVKIGPTGIFVEGEDGEKVKISLSGIKIENATSSGEDDDDDDDDDEDDYVAHGVVLGEDGKLKVTVKKPLKTRFWLEVPYPIICVIAYLIFGFCDICGGWGLSWVIFITIPVYYSFFEAIYNRRISDFCYPVFVAFIYLVLGMYFGEWHPSWIIFITIPVFYPIADAIDRKIRGK